MRGNSPALPAASVVQTCLFLAWLSPRWPFCFSRLKLRIPSVGIATLDLAIESRPRSDQTLIPGSGRFRSGVMVNRSEDFVCSSESERVRRRTLSDQCFDLLSIDVAPCLAIKLESDQVGMKVWIVSDEFPEDFCVTIKGRKRGLG